MTLLLRRLGLGLLVVALAACAPVRTHESPAALAAQTQREAKLQADLRWTLAAHIAVSDGRDGGSGELQWKQDETRFDFIVRAPVTGRTWRLSGDAANATLEGVEPQAFSGTDPEQLLRERVGWDVPLADLRSWVRGLRAPGARADVQYDEKNLPAVIAQSGWRIEYRDWFSDRDPPLPRKVFASRGNARVRLAIESWSGND
jgi:outer membrane lipoprotein LolB